MVVAFGGDGTINEAANGLAGSDTPLTCLPGGATNVYPRMLGLPNDVVDATEHLLRVADDWHPRWVDLGEVNGRLFTFAAGAGLDASVVRRVDAHPQAQGPLRADASTPRPPSACSCAATSSTRRSSSPISTARRSPASRPSSRTATRTRSSATADRARRRPDARLGRPRRRRSSSARRAVDIPTVMYRALSRRAKVDRHRRVTAFQRRRVASRCAPPTAATSRSRSTATTSAPSRGRLHRPPARAPRRRLTQIVSRSGIPPQRHGWFCNRLALCCPAWLVPSHVRDAVADLLGERHAWTVDDAHAALGDRECPADRASVHRALVRLVRAGRGAALRARRRAGVVRGRRPPPRAHRLRRLRRGRGPCPAASSTRPPSPARTGFAVTGHSLTSARPVRGMRASP